MDCPEKRPAFGSRAKQATSKLVFGQTVTVRDLGQDRYGRTVGEVILPEGRSLNHELVKAGFAWWYRRYAPEDDTLKQLEQEAREAKRGLWVDAKSVPPWEWRGKRKSPRDYLKPRKESDAGAPASTFEIVGAGKSCHAGTTSVQTLHCAYKVGAGLAESGRVRTAGG
ncbi:MAG: thermonuclease family protein [Candidatus Tectomicrobia bacterium]